MSKIVTKRGATVKKLIFTCLIMFMLIFTYVNANAAQLYYNDEYHYYDAGEIGLKVNGQAVTNLPMHPVIINDYTMVPAREVFEEMGCEVVWHDDICSVEIIDDGVSIFVKIGDRNVIVAGNKIPIDEPQPLPMLIGKTPAELKTMVPVRFIAEKLGFLVEWDNDTRTVLISKEELLGNTETETDEEENQKFLFGKVTGKSDDRYDYVYIPTTNGISPKISRYTSPDRIAIDFPNSKFSSLTGGVNLYGNCIDTVRFANHDEYARVVLDIATDTQIMILSDENGIVIRAEESSNEKIIYDAFSKRVYFDKNYVGNIKKVDNGCSVTFTNLSLENQKIEIHDGTIYEIIISNSGSGCTVTVDGSNKLSYTAEKGFYMTDFGIVEEDDDDDKNEKPVVVIDAGHGGEDPGAIGYKNGKIVAKESHINLAIALLVGEKLKNDGVEVIYTRDKDEYITLKDRSDLSNNLDCDLFVSIHCNSIENPEIKGTQVYYHPASETGALLADNIYKNMVNQTALIPMGKQNGSHLYVIRTTIAPAVIVETAFISNESDRGYLTNQENQETMAEAIYQGIVKTLNEK